MNDMKKLEISKIKEKEEILDVRGQDCWTDCARWVNNTAGLKDCEYRKDCYQTCFGRYGKK